MFKKMKQDMRETWRVGRKLGSAPTKLISQNLNEIIEGIQMLESIADADAVPLLLFVLRDKDDRYWRVSSQVYPLARRALLKVKDPRAVELFLPALNDKKKEVQEVAVIALGQLR